MKHDISFSLLWEVVKLVLLSHGQASVERGFSVNKQIAVESMEELSYISLQIVCIVTKSLRSVAISKELKA